jgi:hypothetical protein
MCISNIIVIPPTTQYPTTPSHPTWAGGWGTWRWVVFLGGGGIRITLYIYIYILYIYIYIYIYVSFSLVGGP